MKKAMLVLVLTTASQVLTGCSAGPALANLIPAISRLTPNAPTVTAPPTTSTDGFSRAIDDLAKPPLNPITPNVALIDDAAN